MLRSLNSLEGYSIHARDGDLGTVVDCLFDVHPWVVRHLVVNTGSWLSGKRVLVSPIAIRETHWDTKKVDVSLTREQVRTSPPVDDVSPTAGEERALHEHYGWPFYWASDGLWGAWMTPAVLAEQIPTAPRPQVEPARALRSAREVTGYRIAAEDGDLGEAADFIVDDADWQLRYLVVDTRKFWFGGKKVLVDPAWIREVRWEDGHVVLGLTKAQIQASPEWTPDQPINRKYEVRLYDYYGRPRYWDEDGPGPGAHPPTI